MSDVFPFASLLQQTKRQTLAHKVRLRFAFWLSRQLHKLFVRELSRQFEKQLAFALWK